MLHAGGYTPGRLTPPYVGGLQSQGEDPGTVALPLESTSGAVPTRPVPALKHLRLPHRLLDGFHQGVAGESGLGEPEHVARAIRLALIPEAQRDLRQ